MNIIVCGSDGVGKSTFIRNLQELTNMAVVQGSSFEISEKGTEEMYKWSKEMLETGSDMIYDRFFYSNAVYGDLFGYPTMTEAQFSELNDMANKNSVVYYLTADTDVIKNRLVNRGDDMVNPEDIEGIKLGYEKMWNKYMPDRLVTLRVDDDTLLDIESEIYKKVLEYNAEVKKLVNQEEELKDDLNG